MKNISNNYPEWNATGTEPDQTKKDAGWQPGEKPPADWFNWLFSHTDLSFEDIDEGIANRISDIFTNGVLQGGEVTENSTPDLNILVEPLTGFNTNGARINLASQQTVDLSTYLPTTTGNERWISVYADVIDLETNVEINIVEGASAAASSAAKPAIDNSQGVLLADVLLSEGQTEILNTDINESRKEIMNLDLNSKENLLFAGEVVDDAYLNRAHDVKISRDGYAFVVGKADGEDNPPDGSFAIIDLSNPESPTLVQGFDENSVNGSLVTNAQTVEVISENWVIIGSDEGLTAVNVSNLGNVLLETDFNLQSSTPNSLWHINGWIRYNNLLFIANKGTRGGASAADGYLTVVDISDPAEMKIVKEYATGANDDFGGLHDVDRFNDKIIGVGRPSDYGGTYHFGIWNAIDVIKGKNRIDFINESLIQDATNLEGANRVRVKGHYAYVACGAGNPKLTIIDIEDTSNPQIVNSITLDGNSYGLALRNNRLAVTEGSAVGLYDISSPESPVLISKYRDKNVLDSISHDIEFWGDIIAVTSDFNNKLALLKVDTLELTSLIVGAITGGIAYLQQLQAREINAENIMLNGRPVETKNKPAFSAYLDTATNILSGVVPFDTIEYENTKTYSDTRTSDFQVGSHKYIVPEDGLYQINTLIKARDIADGEEVILTIYKNSNEHRQIQNYTSGALHNGGIGGGLTMPLKVGDEIDIRITYESAHDLITGFKQTYFQGHKIDEYPGGMS